MTREEALQRIVDNNYNGEYGFEWQILIDCMAVAREIILDLHFQSKALEQDTVPFDFELDQAGLMDMPKEMIKVLDQIRVEIEEYRDSMQYSSETLIKWEAINYILEHIIDKYKIGIEEKE